MALTALTSQLVAQIRISGVQKAPQGTATVSTVTGPEWSGGGSDNQVLSFGTSSGKADIACCAAWVIAASGTKSFDLLAGTDFLDVMGNTAAFAKLKSVYFQVVDGTGDTSGVVIGGAASNGNKMWFGNVNDTWTIADGSPPFIGGTPAGVTVDGTHKNILLTNGSASVAITVLIAFLGSSV